MTGTLTIAIPKGRIYQELAPILQRVGIAPEDAFFAEEARQLRFATNHSDIEIIRVRSFDVPAFVAYGGAQLGVAGSDVLAENDYPSLLAPLDPADYPLDDVFPEVQLTDYHQIDGVTYAVPEKFGYNAIAFDSDKVSLEQARNIETLFSSQLFQTVG